MDIPIVQYAIQDGTLRTAESAQSYPENLSRTYLQFAGRVSVKILISWTVTQDE